MFGLRAYANPFEIMTWGRPGCLEAPVYIMKPDGRPVMRFTKFGHTAEHGEGGKAKDKEYHRVGDKPWQTPTEEMEREERSWHL